jgi:hypothetical protein
MVYCIGFILFSSLSVENYHYVWQYLFEIKEKVYGDVCLLNLCNYKTHNGFVSVGKGYLMLRKLNNSHEMDIFLHNIWKGVKTIYSVKSIVKLSGIIVIPCPLIIFKDIVHPKNWRVNMGNGTIRTVTIKHFVWKRICNLL